MSETAQLANFLVLINITKKQRIQNVLIACNCRCSPIAKNEQDIEEQIANQIIFSQR